MQKNTENSLQDWIDSMKIALLEKDSNRAFELTQNLPFDESFLENRDFGQNNNITRQEYLAMIKELIAQTIDLLQNNQNATKMQLDRIRQTRKFFM